jgi:hypothetical protein
MMNQMAGTIVTEKQDTVRWMKHLSENLVLAEGVKIFRGESGRYVDGNGETLACMLAGAVPREVTSRICASFGALIGRKKSSMRGPAGGPLPWDAVKVAFPQVTDVQWRELSSHACVKFNGNGTPFQIKKMTKAGRPDTFFRGKPIPSGSVLGTQIDDGTDLAVVYAAYQMHCPAEMQAQLDRCDEAVAKSTQAGLRGCFPGFLSSNVAAVNVGHMSGLHSDSSDYGRYNVLVAEKPADFHGGLLYLPELCVAFDICPGDVFVLRNDVLHCNTPSPSPAQRTSVVFYVKRTKIQGRKLSDGAAPKRRARRRKDDKPARSKPARSKPARS